MKKNQPRTRVDPFRSLLTVLGVTSMWRTGRLTVATRSDSSVFSLSGSIKYSGEFKDENQS